jgi:glycosyltransferase involved in cell wall biosynthesis
MRYVIDVTQLVHWPGNLTGIPRVMDELAIRFAQQKSENSIFVSWVREVGEMCVIDFQKTRQHRGSGIDYIRTSNEPMAAASSATKTLAKKVIKKLAAKSRLDRTNVFKAVAETNRTAEAQSYKVYTPEKEDAFFIPWGEWWEQAWLDKVTDYSQRNVAIYPLCHDVLPMTVPHFSGNSESLAAFVTQIFPLATTVITQSKSTKKDLTTWMESQSLAIPPIKIFRLGEDFSTTTKGVDAEAITSKYGVAANEYLLYVSTIEPRKNHTLLYYTYKLAKSRGITLPKLLIIGRVGHDTSEIIKFIKEDPDVHGSLQICDYVSDDELGWLYAHCRFTVVPSFYEGWGMSVVESIAKGKPAVCSNTSSLVEMPKGCVTYFNPSSTDECLDAIINMNNPATLKKYQEQASNYTLHSWDDSFKQLIKILDK